MLAVTDGAGLSGRRILREHGRFKWRKEEDHELRGPAATLFIFRIKIVIRGVG